MKALLIDIGNSRIKWAPLNQAHLGRQQAAAYAGWSARDFKRAVFGGARPERVLIASVASAAINAQVRQASLAALGLAPLFIRSERRLGGVTTRYTDPWRLGVDRLAGLIGAHHLVPTRPLCVIDIGTAMTIDVLDRAGVHRGGAIVPGPRLMIDSLLKDTNGIRRRAAGRIRGSQLFARDTRSAVEQGARYACAALIDRAVAEARAGLDAAPVVLVTGGGAAQVARLLLRRHRIVADLVLRGLACLV